MMLLDGIATGSVLGAWVMYVLARRGGRPMVQRLPGFLGVAEHRLARTESWFARRGDAVVLLARLIPGARVVVSIPAGTLGLPPWRFLLCTAIGSLVWNTALIGVGAALATRWGAVKSTISCSSSLYLAATVIVVLLLLVLRRVRTLGVVR